MVSGFAAPRNASIYYAYPQTPDHTLFFQKQRVRYLRF